MRATDGTSHCGCASSPEAVTYRIGAVTESCDVMFLSRFTIACRTKLYAPSAPTRRSYLRDTGPLGPLRVTMRLSTSTASSFCSRVPQPVISSS